MEHRWSLICKEAIVNQETNNVSLIEVLERVEFETDPSVKDLPEGMIPFSVALVSMWSRSEPDKPERLPIRLVIKAPDGKIVKSEKPGLFQINLDQHQNMRVTFNIPALPFRGDGLYSYEVQRKTSTGWRTAAAIPLTIIRRFSEEST